MFSNKEVAPVLRKGFVEARLHTDMTESMKGYEEFNARIQEVKTRYLGAGNIGLPHYFLFDPSDLGKPIARRAGKAPSRVFLEFFRAAQTKVGRSGG